MSLDIGDALRDGFDRTVARNGLVLMGLFLLVRLASAVSSGTVTRANQAFLEGMGQPPSGAAGGIPGVTGVAPGTTPFALPVSLPAAIGLAIAVAFVAEAVRIVAVRTFASDHTESIPGALAWHNLTVATLNGVVGGIVVVVLIALGLLFLIVPGLFLAVSFYFVRQEIAVRDKNFVDAMADSWALTRGHRIELFGLAVILAVVQFLASLPGVALVFLSPAVGIVGSAAAGAVAATFGTAVVSRAYVQLADDADEDEEDDDGGVRRADPDSEFDFEV